MFKNLQLFRLPNGISANGDALESSLAAIRFSPCGANDTISRGWVAPYPANGELSFSSNNQTLLCYQTEEKILPASYVNRVCQAKAEAIEESQGFKPGRKQMREIKEQVIAELTPRAFTKIVRSYCWIDNANGWLCIEGSRDRAETIISLLAKTLPAIPQCRLPRMNASPVSAMADWLASGEPPERFTIDRECQLTMAGEEQGKVKYSRVNIDTDEVRSRLAQGGRPNQLAMTFNDRISFILTDRLEIRRIHVLDIVTKQIEQEAEDTEQLFYGTFLIFTNEISELIRAIVSALGGEEISDIERAVA